MKRLLLVAIVISIFSSCSQDEEPLFDIKIEMSKSEVFQSALISIDYFSFYRKDQETEQVETSIIQQWLGIEIDQDLTNVETNAILVDSHWEMELDGVKPLFSLSINKDGQSENVRVDYIEFITLPSRVNIEKNKEYELIIKIDTDNAIENLNGEYVLNWNFVTSSILEV